MGLTKIISSDITFNAYFLHLHKRQWPIQQTVLSCKNNHLQIELHSGDTTCLMLLKQFYVINVLSFKYFKGLFTEKKIMIRLKLFSL
jgi:hypothetical protein